MSWGWVVAGLVIALYVAVCAYGVVILIRDRRAEKRAAEDAAIQAFGAAANQAAQSFIDMKQAMQQASVAVGGVIASAVASNTFGWSTAMTTRGEQSNFSGQGESAGTVYGLRNWRVTDAGVLTGVMYSQSQWKPGENDARCFRSRRVPITGTTAFHTVAWPTDGWDLDHDMEGCTHGFYAYWDGSRDYHEKGDVTGIIRGTGTTRIGTKGFRTTTAEIVAIKFSGTVPVDVRALVLANYPDAAVFKTVASMLTEFPLTAVADEPDEPIEEAS